MGMSAPTMSREVECESVFKYRSRRIPVVELWNCDGNVSSYVTYKHATDRHQVITDRAT